MRLYQAYCMKIHERLWQRLAACKRVFPLRYSETCSTFANYVLLRYKMLVLVVMECKRAHVIRVYELIFLLHTWRSTEYTAFVLDKSFLYQLYPWASVHWNENCRINVHLESLGGGVTSIETCTPSAINPMRTTCWLVRLVTKYWTNQRE